MKAFYKLSNRSSKELISLRWNTTIQSAKNQCRYQRIVYYSSSTNFANFGQRNLQYQRDGRLIVHSFMKERAFSTNSDLTSKSAYHYATLLSKAFELSNSQQFKESHELFKQVPLEFQGFHLNYAASMIANLVALDQCDEGLKLAEHFLARPNEGPN